MFECFEGGAKVPPRRCRLAPGAVASPHEIADLTGKNWAALAQVSALVKSSKRISSMMMIRRSVHR